MKEVCNPATPARGLAEARKDLVERVGAGVASQKGDDKEEARFLARALCRVAGMQTLCVDDVGPMLEALRNDELVEAHCALTELLARHFPAVFGGFGSQLAAVLQAACEDKRGKRAEAEAAMVVDAVTLALRRCQQQQQQPPPRALVDVLKTIAKGGVRHLGMRSAVHACKALHAVSPDAFIKLAEQCKLDDRALTTALPVLFVLTRLAPEARSAPTADRLVEAACRTCKAPWPDAVKKADVELKVVAAKVIGAEVWRRVTAASDEAQQQQQQHATSTHALLLLLRRFVADGGDPWGAEARRKTAPDAVAWPPSTDDHFAQLRLAAAKWLTRLDGLQAARRALAEGKSVAEHVARAAQRFIERGWLALDPVASVRDGFASALSKHVLDKGMQMTRDGALLCLVASSGTNAAAAADFRALVKHLAAKSAQYRRTNSDDDDNDDVVVVVEGGDSAEGKGERLATLTAPECLLPNLVYLLAHHPLLPADAAKAAQFVSSADGQRALTRPLTTLFDALVAAHGGGSRMDGSVSFMLALLAQMRARADARAPADTRVHLVGDMCRVLIQHHIKRYSPEALQAYTGHVPLPACFVDAEPAAGKSAAPKTPLQAHDTNSAVLPSPISYLPAGFELFGKAAAKRASGASAKKARRASSAKKPKKAPSSSASRRSQPRRSSQGAAGRKSYAGYFSSSSSNGSSEEDDDDDDDVKAAA